VSKIDDLIGRALDEEDKALLARQAEPGYIAQAFGIFRGPMAWVMWLVNVAAGIAFLAGLYSIWQMSGAAEALAAVKWGVAALALFQVTMLCKTFMGSHLEANRMLREIKRVELQVALLREGSASSR
jgi:hypothetical protein